MAVLYDSQEPLTLPDCLSPNCWLQFIICCSGFYTHAGRFVINRWTRLYTLSGAGLVVLGLSSCTYTLLQLESVRERLFRYDKMVLCIMALELAISTLAFIVTVVALQLKAQQHLNVLQRLAELDRRLVCEFGANLNYNRLKRKSIFSLTTVSLLLLAACHAGLATLLGGEHLHIALPAAFCYCATTMGPHLTGYMHMLLAELICIRFRLLQQLLKQTVCQQQLIEQRLQGLVHMIKELHYLIASLNKVYNLSLWSAMIHDYTLSTSQLYIIFGRSVGTGNQRTGDSFGLSLLACLYLSMFLAMYKMFVSPIYCSRCVHEGRQCLHLVQQLEDAFPHRPAVRQLAEAIMRWRLEFKIEFSSGSGIVLNKTLISQFTLIVFNYLLVLIQFTITQKLGEQVEDQKVALQDWIGI